MGLLVSCNTEKQIKETTEHFYVGTYTDGISEGIYKYSISAEGILDSVGLVAQSVNPSFLTFSSDKKYLLACNEVDTNNGEGSIESFEVGKDKLSFIDRKTSGGAHPCFITISDKRDVLVANYSGGNIGLLKLSTDGSLSNLLFVEEHNTDTLVKAHAHSAWFIPNSNDVVSVDLGTNELWFSEIVDSKLVPSVQNKITMEVGAGPRHLTMHPKGWFYVVNELNSTVSLVAKNNEGVYELKKSTSTLPSDYQDKSYCADIHLSEDGKFLYASNRGHNSIVVFSVNDLSGELTVVEFESVKGDWPRNFTITDDGRYLLVANQKSNNIVSFKRDAKKGTLEFVSEINAPSPVCLLF